MISRHNSKPSSGSLRRPQRQSTHREGIALQDINPSSVPIPTVVVHGDAEDSSPDKRAGLSSPPPPRKSSKANDENEVSVSPASSLNVDVILRLIHPECVTRLFKPLVETLVPKLALSSVFIEENLVKETTSLLLQVMDPRTMTSCLSYPRVQSYLRFKDVRLTMPMCRPSARQCGCTRV